MTDHPRAERSALFATGAIGLAAAALLVTIVVAATSGGGDPSSAGATAAIDDGPVELDDGAVADQAVDPDELMARSATAMGAVSSVEFRLERSGTPVFIDQFDELALDSLRGQFSVPNRAQAELTITVDGDLTTRIGAVAIDSEVWISNPVTGDFETLPAGYDIDPSRFFDPEDGWEPLLANLADVELVGVENRGGERYHVRGTAAADDVRDITVDLVRDQDVPVDFWIHPGTALVTAVEFTTSIDGGESTWVLELRNYGDAFTIEPPANIRG